MTLPIPAGAAALLERLEQQGHPAYVVGGCVRDSLLGRPVHDWDICTGATPAQVRACCAGLPVLDTGLAHGTVTVLWEGVPYEVTTFRREGAYANHRRPQQVTLVQSLAEDLARRDFTINAMAYNPRTGLVDLHDGQRDLARRCIRCVGNPAQRFAEDALRMLRALRFASQLGFVLDDATACALEEQQAWLGAVSAERVFAELTGLLCGVDVQRVLEQYSDVLCAVLPEIAPCVGFDQRSPYHDRDVWRHIAYAVGEGVPDVDVRWALLLHDLGKPATFLPDETGRGHFPGHGAVSEAIAQVVLTRLRASRAQHERVVQLVALHDEPLVPTEKSARRWLARLGPAQLHRLIEVQRADSAAHAQSHPAVRARPGQLDAFEALVEAQLAKDACISLHNLALNGDDVLAMGVPQGPQVGRILHALLARVVDGTLPNRRADLQEAAQALWREERPRKPDE